ncbi:hypothetical protein I553_2483 [Mycobacterium xenopi 4042]|uniref:Uncharacterized protein n=2 Tax=Mycobacterium xenopi TaxID=1789 RepID=A0AAD1H4N6_MYCXE|nr:hypothetical protein I553_2483 [Mycobacterium xenopi 4042]BBU24317.1 hypothetical protein MYXE_41070 [Mycobacterium xenopi]SPX90380.1 Uncharacterised protein [Mycobacterium xenopi]
MMYVLTKVLWAPRLDLGAALVERHLGAFPILRLGVTADLCAAPVPTAPEITGPPHQAGRAPA